MANLSSFSKEERALIISVPYRVGIWISNADDNERTKLDDKFEKQTLEVAIATLAKRTQKMPFAAAVMSDVETYKSMWPGWEAQAGENSVLEDTQEAIDICRAKVSKGELNQYKHAVWQIGIVVAQAFGEHIDPDNEMHVDRFFAWMGSLMGQPKLTKNPENMSPAEKTALKKLRAVLKS